jgi:uncharacterized protein
MNSYTFSVSKNKNKYLLDNKCVCYVHPNLSEDSNDEYYRKKYDYLANHGFFENDNSNHNARISPDQIINKVVNLKQLVFEVTDACNLKCKYCGYGELYTDYDIRHNNRLSINQVKPLLDYLYDLWINNPPESHNGVTFISFYGGEPLLNMPFIEDIVEYFRNINIKGKKFRFSMTTNAVLLNKYMDFLVENNFLTLISMDGNEYNHGYRVDINGKNSFDRVIENVNLLQKSYPDYFKKSVNFNAVLHNRNTVAGIYDFIHSGYDKTPSIGELNNSGIRADKHAEFERLYKSSESLFQEENYREVEQSLFMNIYSYKNATTFLHQYTNGVFKTYNDLLYDKVKKKFIPTGTCIPFSKKMYITVNRKILPCERIGHQFALGKITNVGVEIDYDEIADEYNFYYDNLERQCSRCHRIKSCIQCVFYIKDLKDKPVCHGFMDRSLFSKYVAANMSFWEEHPKDYKKVMEEVVIY